jgi:hypothetical protein
MRNAIKMNQTGLIDCVNISESPNEIIHGFGRFTTRWLSNNVQKKIE